jgi:hypothetical protein
MNITSRRPIWMTDGARFGALMARDSIMSILQETPDLSVLPGSRGAGSDSVAG